MTKESRGRERKKEREETDRYDLVCYTQIVTLVYKNISPFFIILLLDVGVAHSLFFNFEGEGINYFVWKK